MRFFTAIFFFFAVVVMRRSHKYKHNIAFTNHKITIALFESGNDNAAVRNNDKGNENASESKNVHKKR